MKTYKSTVSEFKLAFNKTKFVKVKIQSSRDAVEYARQFYHEDLNIYESSFIMLLNRANNIIGYAKISQGGIAGTVIDVKIVAKYAIDSLASGIILFHNHPSGNLIPSDSDKNITRIVKNTLNIFDCNLVDHCIITDTEYYSFADSGDL